MLAPALRWVSPTTNSGDRTTKAAQAMKKETAQPVEGGIELFKLGFWVAIGMMLGTVVGALMGNVGVGIAIGIVIGAAIGVVLGSRELEFADATGDEETTK